MTVDASDPAARLQHFATRLLRIARTTHKGHALTSSQYSLMALLYEHPDTSIVELAKREGVAHPTISRIVAGLARSGLVERKPHSRDKRVSVVRLSTAGEQLYIEVAQRRVMLFRLIIAQLKPETVDELLAVAERFATGVENDLRSS
ncbi:MarR family transcriptional regulator [Porphyrobacter sp. SLTP]|uniref:MarR family winged helix-turn-helix transcriptional regulator n=1 Tax=Porphyrobacter sp. SLTP TaxID=2683266 RepID=UPI002570C4EB|nr:MarR family transcriptional regulator [Porphyrobacter sp. SLTP]